jgi:hypothetical protein
VPRCNRALSRNPADPAPPHGHTMREWASEARQEPRRRPRVAVERRLFAVRRLLGIGDREGVLAG